MLFATKIIRFIFLWPHVISYLLSKNRLLIQADVLRRKKYRNYNYENEFLAFLCQVLWREPEFRNQFYGRLGRINVFFLNLILPSLKSMDIENMNQIGEGFVLIHGHGTVINAECKVGKNCTVLQNVTLGSGNGGSPIIGDNVYVGCGSQVIGGITVGNNVTIGAGSVVVKDVPDNVVVAGVPAKIINKKG